MAMEMWEIMVPTVDNDGTPFKTRHHREWDNQVKKITGGLTIHKPARGIWVDNSDSKTYNERMIPVRIACNREQIIEIMKRVKNHYKQIDVLAYKVSDDVIFLSKI